MIIPINDLYRICSDEYQWIIQKKRNRKGKEDWASRHYYPTFESAVRSLGELMVRQSKADTLADCIGGSRKRCPHALPSPDTHY